MKNKIYLISSLIFMIVFFTALYIVIGTLGDYRHCQALGEYSQKMYARDMVYIRLHNIPIKWVMITMFSLGYIMRLILEWAFKKD